MSRLYDTIEPDVISEALIHKCVLEQGPDGEAGRIAKEEGIDFKEVTQLRLDFQSNYKITFFKTKQINVCSARSKGKMSQILNSSEY